MHEKTKQCCKFAAKVIIKAAAVIAAILLILWWLYPDIFCAAARPDCSGAEQNNIYNIFCKTRYNCPADTIPL